MKFERNNLKSKKNFYLILISLELATYASLFYLKIHWIFLVLIFPFLILEIISNKRCLNRQKNFIKEIEFRENEIVCKHLNDSTTRISYKKLIYSFREIKFEKDKSEIEIREKKRIRSKLIGRLHINNWKAIFEIRNALVEKKIVRIKFRPEGFWSKYGGLTADIVIISTALAVGEVANLSGDINTASDMTNIALETNLSSLNKKHENKASS
jgi:hypothetical protein